MSKVYDLIIVGGGPAGCSAAVYAARKRLNSALILKDWGGQSVVSDDIQNWIGSPHISGSDLAKNMEKHVKEYAGEYLDIFEGIEIISSEKSSEGVFILKDKKNNTYIAKNILITTGSNRRKLNVEDADRFEHRGLTYCATCDGPMFTDMDVIVVGGGNAGFESAAQLLAYCKSVTLLSRGEPRADKITIEKLLQNPKFAMVKNSEIVKLKGEVMLESVIYKYTDDNKNVIEKELNVGGVFVEIGGIPASSWCDNVITKDSFDRIMIDPWTQRCVDENKKEIKGVWAAGDVTNILYHQNNIASGDAVKAIEDIYKNIHS